jgi:DUF1365 family protein
LNYPIFFSCLDLDEIQKYEFKLWPVFSINSGWRAFSSLDSWDHLKGWFPNETLAERVRLYIQKKLNCKEKPSGNSS